MADDLLLEWPSGVGGVQCDGCERTTICRRVGLADEEWLCRPCAEGWGDDDDTPDTMMVTFTGTRHRVGGTTRWGRSRLLVAQCDGRICIRATVNPLRVADCGQCFPSSADSLGAASTTLNPPPGEHTGDQNA